MGFAETMLRQRLAHRATYRPDNDALASHRAIDKRGENLVVGVFAALVFGEIAHTFQLREFV